MSAGRLKIRSELALRAPEVKVERIDDTETRIM